MEHARFLAALDARSVSSTSSHHLPERMTFSKYTFSKYNGKLDPTTLYSWIHQFEAYFATAGRKSDNDKVILASWYRVRPFLGSSGGLRLTPTLAW